MPPSSLVFAAVALLAIGTSSPVAAQTASPLPVPLPSSPATVVPPEGPTPTPIPTASAALVPAGVVPAGVTVDLGGTVSPAFAAVRIRAAIVRAAALQPGATLTVSGVTVANSLHAGDSVEALAGVAIAGGDAYAGVVGTTAVHVRVETLAQLDPAFLFYSDDPEKLAAGDDGVLYKNSIDTTKAARVSAYDVTDTPGRRLYLSLQSSSTEAHVQVLGYAAGPADEYGYVGHVATLQYLLERGTQESFVADVVPGTPYLEPLGSRTMNPSELVAAIFDLRVLDGGAVDVAVVAASGTTDPASLLAGSELPGDGHGRRGEFSLQAVPPLALTYAAGDPDPSPVPVGDATIPNLRPGGHPLGGDYGVIRPVSFQLSNPGGTPQAVYLYEQPVGGFVTTTIWFAGDPRPTEVPCVHEAANRYQVRSFALDPGASISIGGEYMTDGASSYPLDFGLTSVPPSPPPGPYSPDACNPHTPPPSPSPSPQASSQPVASPPPPSAPSPAPSPT
jgi:hypothetical protein